LVVLDLSPEAHFLFPPALENGDQLEIGLEWRRGFFRTGFVLIGRNLLFGLFLHRSSCLSVEPFQQRREALRATNDMESLRRLPLL
jgi:hypothetical protein